MSGLVQISEAASIGIHACLWLAAQQPRLCRSPELCRQFGFSTAHFAKVMQNLARAGIVESVRGPKGGARLARDPAAITLLEVYEALEGALDGSRCLLSPRVCPSRCCPLGREIARLNRGLRATLAKATLSSLSAATDWSGFTKKNANTPKGERR